MDRQSKVNILLVDDQPAKLLTYEAILGELGENLVKASSGRDALRRLLQTEFAVVLLDVCMPDLDGFELASMIREHPRLAKTAIILVSSVFMTDIDRLKGYHAGAVDYVPVPIIPEVLRAKVRVFSDLYRKTEQLRVLNTELERRVELRTLDLENTTASMRKSEERFRFLAETIPSMLWIAALDGTITYANRRWLEYRGLSDVPAGCQWPDFEVHADDRERWCSEWKWHRERGERFEIEARHGRHDGRYRWFLTRAVPKRTDSGEPVCWFGVTVDIHEQKELQQRLREADRRKDEFLAMLSHELRNPLAPIRNAAQVLRQRAGNEPGIAWCVDVVERQTANLARLVNDLLDVSRITRGKIELQKQPLDLATVIARAVETNRPLLEARGHVLHVEGPERPTWVDGDPMRLGQVFDNLINNSAKYTDNGGRITISIHTEGGASAGNGQAVVRVIDTGVGIPAGLLPIVFDLFTQGERTLEQAQGGLGVGLALVQRLAVLHGGRVEAHSEGAGRGSEFVVRLPLGAATDQTLAARGGDPRARADVTRVILVVDDNTDSADSLAILLRSGGHDVHTAADGRAAVAAAERLRPDVMLLDLGMPCMSGFEVAKQIRQQAWGKAVYLVAQTGWGQEEDRRRTAAAGFDLHLTKPLDADALLQVLAGLPQSACARP